MTANAPQDSDFEQAPEFVIDDLETLKVIADPLRMQIIESIFDHAHTVKQIAQKLDLPPSKLYYHINLLEKHNLISITSTRIVSGIVEKSYQTSAQQFRVMKGLLTPQRSQAEKDEGVGIFVDAILNDARQDIKQNALAGLIDLDSENSPNSLRISRTTTRLTPEQAVQFHQRIRELIDEFTAHREDGQNPDEQGYALVMAMYPTQRGAPPQQDDNRTDE